jgi:hypothetical protein
MIQRGLDDFAHSFQLGVCHLRSRLWVFCLCYLESGKCMREQGETGTVKRWACSRRHCLSNLDLLLPLAAYM